ncbi:MAG: hypothetical protein JW909_04490 [Planctomycetes bacterium]|nr:hypothetical protein [Planctomycetota bacterium]
MARKAPAVKRRTDCFFGLHFDLHPNENDSDLGADVSESMVDALLKKVKPDFVQYDCKGHRGYSGYPTAVGTPAPGIKKDSLKIWRKVTRRRGVALFVHYSGVWDTVAASAHPDWARIDENGAPDPNITSTFGPYAELLLIPQLKELARDYGIDGAWIDGECWAILPDYCDAAKRAFREETGHFVLPLKRGDTFWREFLDLNRHQFLRYLARYVQEVHRDFPDFQICSNWLYSTMVPEPVTVPVDFLSGDFSPGKSVNTARMEARYLASNNMPWDLMAWGFNRAQDTDWSHKAPVQLQQEAAVCISQGGGFQVYYQPTRSGRIDGSLVGVMADVAAFCRKRKAASFRTDSVPQVAVILSSESIKAATDTLYKWNDQQAPAKGALHALLELGYSVDVLSEHQLFERSDSYPLIVLPECSALLPSFVEKLREYAASGGSLMLIGAAPARLFPKELGVRFSADPEETDAFIDADGVLGCCDGLWQPVSVPPARRVASRYAAHDTSGPADAAASVSKFKKGRVGAIYGPAASVHLKTHLPATRRLIGLLAGRLFPNPVVKLSAPPCVDVVLRRKGARVIVHLVNTSGMQQADDYTVVDYVPPVGPVELTVRLKRRPDKVSLAGESAGFTSRWNAGRLRVRIDRIDIHAALVIE